MKTSTPSAVSAHVFNAHRPIYAQDLREVQELLNYVVTHSVYNIVNLDCRNHDGVDAPSQGPAGSGVTFPTALTTTQRAFEFPFFMPKNVKLSMQSVCTMSGVQEGNLRFLVDDVDTIINNHGVGSTSVESGVAALASGWYTGRLDLQTTVVGSGGVLERVTLSTARIAAADLPDPA